MRAQASLSVSRAARHVLPCLPEAGLSWCPALRDAQQHRRLAGLLIVSVKGIYCVLGLLSSTRSVTPIALPKQFYTGIGDLKEPINKKPASPA